MKVISITNYGTIEITLNLIKSIENLNYDYIIYTLDDKVESELKSLNKKTKLHSKLFDCDYNSFSTLVFNQICKEKIKVICDQLASCEEDVLYLDSDVVLLRDISQYIDDNINDFNFLIQYDELVCPGCIYIKNTEESKIFFNHLYDIIDPTYRDDQHYINTILDTINYGKLDRSLYPTGKTYFTEKVQVNPYLVHNNYLIGNNDKINRFKENNMWFI